MSDYTELQKVAAYAAQDTIKFADEDEEMRALQQFHEEVCPETVLALIADLDEARNGMKHSCAIRLKKEIERLESEAVYSAAGFDAAREEISKLRAEVAGLKTGYQAYERVNAELKAENEALKKRIDDLSPFKGAPFTGQDPKCLACGDYHYALGGLPCPIMRVTAQADLPDTRSGQIGFGMEEGGQ